MLNLGCFHGAKEWFQHLQTNCWSEKSRSVWSFRILDFYTLDSYGADVLPRMGSVRYGVRPIHRLYRLLGFTCSLPFVRNRLLYRAKNIKWVEVTLLWIVVEPYPHKLFEYDVGCYCPCSKQIYLCSSLIGSKLNKPGHFHLQLTYLAVSQTFLCTPDQYRALIMRLHGDFQKQEFQPKDTARVKICEA